MLRIGWLIPVVLLSASLSAVPVEGATRHHHRHHVSKEHKLIHAGAWKGAGFAAGQVAGPPGSVAVGAVKYRRDLKRNWHTRRHAMVKIGAPVAAGAVAGPAGIAGYEAYDHRHWLKRHLAPGKHHRHRRHVSRRQKLRR